MFQFNHGQCRIFSPVLVLLATYCFSITLFAQEYEESAQKACRHMRACAQAQLKDVPEEFRAMIEQNLDGMCEAMPDAGDIPGFGPQHELYAPAVACMKSISAMSCEQIEQGVDTPECEKLSRMYSDN